MTESRAPPKNTREIAGVRYRYNVKSYHSTMVEHAAMINDRREAAAGSATRSPRCLNRAGSWRTYPSAPEGGYPQL
jgi:hypothetical protein